MMIGEHFDGAPDVQFTDLLNELSVLTSAGMKS